MLTDMIMEVVRAGEDEKARERAYRNLEKLGMDRMTVNAVISDMAAAYRRKVANQNG